MKTRDGHRGDSTEGTTADWPASSMYLPPRVAAGDGPTATRQSRKCGGRPWSRFAAILPIPLSASPCPAGLELWTYSRAPQSSRLLAAWTLPRQGRRV
ncbi:unnamed protein product, partial [Protopolystoma xenopodis]